ncbi:MAG: hypothetical protein FWD12_13745, partial [Alphaproteobacteria bacterium]|nr:hypothetical protein [Alphaproteobacteria bacterium]
RQVAETLAQPFGLTVIAEEEGEAVPEVQVQQSETCFKLVERLARLQELLVTDNAEGNLVLTRAGNKTTDSALIYGVNIEEASADLDHAHRFSDYIVKAQRPGTRTADSKTAEGRDPWAGVIVSPGGGDPSPGGRAAGATAEERSASLADLWRDAWRERMLALRARPLVRTQRLDGGDETDDWDWDGTPGSGTDTHTDRGMEAISQIAGTAHDDAITRYRPLVIIAEAQADDDNAAKRADWELRRRLAKSTKATIAVNGWHQQNGELWRPNLMVYTEVPYFGLERELIIGQVTFEMGDQGEMTRLELTLPDAFLPEKIRKCKVRRGRGPGRKGRRGGKAPVDNWAGVI